MRDGFVANLAAIAHDAFENQAPVSPDDLLSALAAAPGTRTAEAPAAAADMPDRLCREGCMLRTDAGAATACEPIAPGGAFALPVIEAFRDLEELIAIDPDHETHEFTGWPNRPPSYAVER